jgi:hypothetical protein
MGKIILYAGLAVILSFKRDSCPFYFYLPESLKRYAMAHFRTGHICAMAHCCSVPHPAFLSKKTIISKLHQHNSCPDNNLKHHNSK